MRILVTLPPLNVATDLQRRFQRVPQRESQSTRGTAAESGVIGSNRDHATAVAAESSAPDCFWCDWAMRPSAQSITSPQR